MVRGGPQGLGPLQRAPPRPRSPMFQVPMKMEIMSGSSWWECLFFISCRSWQKASRFCGGGGSEQGQGASHGWDGPPPATSSPHDSVRPNSAPLGHRGLGRDHPGDIPQTPGTQHPSPSPHEGPGVKSRTPHPYERPSFLTPPIPAERDPPGH